MSVAARILRCRRSRGYWDDISKRHEFVAELAQDMSIKTMDAWYKINIDKIREYSAGSLVQLYGYSIHKMLQHLYPWYPWQAWLFEHTPRNCWKDVDTIFEFVKEVEAEYNLRTLDSWYDIEPHDVFALGGTGLITQRFPSLVEFLRFVYSEHEWLPWKFTVESTLQMFWNDERNQLQFLQKVSTPLGISELKDWYRVSKEDFARVGGGNLLNRYGGSVYNMLKHLYPNTRWYRWRFDSHKRVLKKRTTQPFWDVISNRQTWVRNAEEQLRVQVQDDWYCVHTQELIDLGGGQLLNNYSGSLSKLLRRLYPEYEWQPWKFSRAPQNFWHSQSNVKTFLLSLENKLDIKSPMNWYSISRRQLESVGAKSILDYWPAPLRGMYPNYNWNLLEISKRDKRSIQRALLHSVKQLCFGYVVTQEYKPGVLMRLEYQGAQHYFDKPEAFGPVMRQEAIDTEKDTLCRALGITIVPIPFWWIPGDIGSLGATIMQFRSDLHFDVAVGKQPLRHRSAEEPNMHKYMSPCTEPTMSLRYKQIL